MRPRSSSLRLWSLTQSATTKPTKCSVTLDFAPPTASTVTTYLQAKGLPITGLIVYTSATDPNHLLGRPTGYLSRVAWQDPRIDQSNQSSDPGGIEWGGGIEVFSTAQGAEERASYLSSIDQASSLFGWSTTTCSDRSSCGSRVRSRRQRPGPMAALSPARPSTCLRHPEQPRPRRLRSPNPWRHWQRRAGSYLAFIDPLIR